MKNTMKCVALAGIAMSGAAFSANAAGINKQQFNDWVQARCGSGEPVYWYARGDARVFPGGEVLYRFDFMEENRLVADPKDPDNKVCLGRKINLYLDKDTGQVLREFRGQPVSQLIYPYQVIAMTLQGDKVAAVATQGAGKFLRKYNLDDVVHAVSFGGRTYFDATAMFTSHREQGVMNTFEYLTYIMPPDMANQKSPDPGISFTLGYERPVWAGGDGKSDYLLQHAVGTRVKSYDELPAHVREFIKSEAPIFRAPPANMDEIKRLQKGS